MQYGVSVIPEAYGNRPSSAQKEALHVLTNPNTSSTSPAIPSLRVYCVIPQAFMLNPTLIQNKPQQWIDSLQACGTGSPYDTSVMRVLQNVRIFERQQDAEQRTHV